MLLGFKILFFILILGVTYKAYQLMMEHKIAQITIKKLYKHAKNEAKIREGAQRRSREEEGRKEKDNFLRRMDVLIDRSGLSSILTFINTGTYIFITVVAVMICMLITVSVSHSPLIAFVASLSTLFISYLILYTMSGINYKKTEKNLLEFANLLENYSKTHDDIITILYKVYPYLENPLHDAVEECVFVARSTGDVSKALVKLENKIELEKFKEIIRNIEICSRYEANYEEIIKDSRKMLREYISSREERRALIKNSRIEMGIIITCCIFIISILDSYSNIGVINVLLHSLIGNILLGYCVVVLFLTFWVLLAIDK